MKRLLLFLLLIPLAFAGWQSVAGLAMMASLGLLVTIYMIGMGFGITNLQILAKEEFFQLIALGVLIVALISTDGILNEISKSPAFSPGADTMQQAALQMIEATKNELVAIFDEVRMTDRLASHEGSESAQCNIMGMGYGVSGCGAYSMLGTPLSMAGGIIGFAIGEMGAIQKLIYIANEYALKLLLPLGIILRTVRVTRGAGGLLIALGISLFIMLPIGIIFSEILGAAFMDDPLSADYKGGAGIPELDCDAADAVPYGGMTPNEEDAIAGYNLLRANIRAHLYVVLIKGTLGPVLALLLMATSIRTLTSIAGAEVDVSAISRFV